MPRIQDKEHFLGMDRDVATDKMARGDYRFALNIRIGTTDGSNVGNVENIRGNVLVSTPLPSGDNVVIGTFEDTRERTVIYFVWNSMGSHSIRRYFASTNTIHIVVQASVLGFNRTSLITGIGLIGGILEWTDNNKPPRKLNLDKADETTGAREWNLYFPDDAFDFTTGCTYIFTVKDENGNLIAAEYNICPDDGSPSDDGDLPSGMRTLADQINTALPVSGTPLKNVIEAEACGKFIKITAKVGGKTEITLQTTDNHPYRLIAQNFYLDPFREEYFDLIRYPQICQPLVEYKIDEAVSYNFLLRKTFQFRTRLIYDDDEKSTWGSISDLPIDDFSVCNTSDESPFNYIEVNFTDDRLTDDGSLSVIMAVELAVREGNGGAWKKIMRLNQEDFAFDQTFRFFNNGTYTELSQAEADKPFDSVPLLSTSLEIVKGRTVLGGNTEGFDVPCIDGKVAVTFEEPVPPETISTIKGTIRILNRLNNDTELGQDQPIIDYEEGEETVFSGIGGNTMEDVGSRYNQTIPLKGFVVYLSGTNLRAVSVQNTSVAASEGVNILPGGVLSGKSGGGNRASIKDAMRKDGVFSEFEIENVPDGEYVLRVASHLCVDSGGGIFDINGSDLRYQKTSTRTKSVGNIATDNSSITITPGENELIINIKVGGGTIDVGNIEVDALDDPSAAQESIAIEGYLFDPEFEPVDENTIRDRPNMELQSLSWSGVSFVITTDHNGFGYASENPVFGNPFTTLTALSIRPDGFTNNDGLVIKDSGAALFEGGLEGTLTNISDGEIDFGGDRKVIQLIVYNHNTNVTSYCRTIVNGRVLDPDGIPVAGVNVVIGRTTRRENTNSNGEYSILVYGDRTISPFVANSRVEDIHFSYLENCVVDLPTESSVSIDVDPFTKNEDFDNSNPFTADDFIVDGFFAILTISHKRGGNYQYGLGYYDVAGRFTTIATEERLEFYIPFFTEDINTYFPTQFPIPGTFETGTAIVNWEIFHEAPPWAVAYRWYRTENTLYNFYLQWIANSIKYVSRFDTENDTPVEVSFGSSEAAEIYINIENIQFFKDENSDSQLAYQFQEGDRIRIMADEKGVFFETFFDFPVKNQRGFDVIIDAENSLPELKRGMLFEVYTPKLNRTENFFFEVGPCYDIVDGQHSVTADVFREGDTYNRQRVMIAQNDSAGTGGVDRFKRAIESASISDFYTSQVSGIGRPNIIDDDSREVFRGSELKFSNLFIEGTNVNGLSTFDAINSKVLGQEFGTIQKVAFLNNVLLVLFPAKSLTLYINRSIITDLVGQGIQAQSSKFFSQENELNGDFGTLNPESFVVYKGRAYWWDLLKGTPVQYDNNGTGSINYQMDRYFSPKALTIQEDPDITAVVGAYDSFFNSYVLTFRSTRNTVGETLAYNTLFRRWVSFYSYVPQFYGMNEKLLVSFNDSGELWAHNRSNTYNSIYGTSFVSQIRVINNEDNDAMKIWFNIAQRSTNPWECPEIVNDEGQKTNLIPADFVDGEGDQWYADFLRDENTPNISTPLILGDVMRSRVLEVLMQISSSTLEVLSGVDVYSTSSERTNK